MEENEDEVEAEEEGGGGDDDNDIKGSIRWGLGPGTVWKHPVAVSEFERVVNDEPPIIMLSLVRWKVLALGGGGGLREVVDDDDEEEEGGKVVV